MSDAERKLAQVYCNHANGLVLRLHRPHHHENGADCKIPDPDREPVELHAGSNDVDEEFVVAWLEENFGDGGDLVRNGTIGVPEELQQRAQKRLKEKPADNGEVTRARGAQ